MKSVSGFFTEYVYFQCRVIADCFMLSVDDGWASEDFTRKVMTQDWGLGVMMDRKMIEYSDYHYMYRGFVNSLNKVEGETYPKHIMEYAGYLYKYWYAFYGVHPMDIYSAVPLSSVVKGWGFWHTQGWNYVVDLLSERLER